jgi:hypothetical protein
VSDVDSYLRLINTGFRRFARDPETRVESSRLILKAAVALHGEYASAGDVALACAEAVSPMAASDRLKRRGAA